MKIVGTSDLKSVACRKCNKLWGVSKDDQRKTLLCKRCDVKKVKGYNRKNERF